MIEPNGVARDRPTMRPELESRLRIVFAAGYLDEPDQNACLDRRFLWHDALHGIMHRRGFEIVFGGDGFCGTVCEFAVTKMPDPSFDQWLSLGPGGGQRQLDWLEANGGVYPALWIQISRVWPAVSTHFNVWQKGEDNRRLAIESESPTAGGWTDLLADIERCLRPLGVVRLSDAELHELVPFVIDRVPPPDDESPAQIDGGDDVDWIEEPANVAQCLFQPL